VAATAATRRFELKKGSELWRSQLGNAYREEPAEDFTLLIPIPFDDARMKPQEDRAKEGRANPIGLPYLYCAIERQIALSEVRPGLGSYVSIARLEVAQDLVLVDCSLGASDTDPIFYALNHLPEPPQPERAAVVWGCIDRAFSEPVDRSDDVAGYAPTQIIAELLKLEGYDGVKYRSSLNEGGHNVVLFDVSSTEIRERKLCTVRRLDYYFEDA
jgi:hypothetical protein